MGQGDERGGLRCSPHRLYPFLLDSFLKRVDTLTRTSDKKQKHSNSECQSIKTTSSTRWHVPAALDGHGGLFQNCIEFILQFIQYQIKDTAEITVHRNENSSTLCSYVIAPVNPLLQRVFFLYFIVFETKTSKNNKLMELVYNST